MILVDDDHMVGAVSAKGSDQALHAHVTDTSGELVTVDAVAVTKEISRGAVPGNAPTICCAVHLALGDSVTLMRTFDRALQDNDLLPQCEILKGQSSVECQR